MERNTKIELNNKISISSSCYSDTDYLLCHDDNMGDRRIAFVLYLSENWEVTDGGALDLFDTDENGLPRNIVRSLVPEYNSLVFFEVTENSFHQVAEVTSSEKCRWSINGWFHGPLIEKDRPLREDTETAPIEPENMQFDLKQWISKSYLLPAIIRDIKVNVEYESFAFLHEFLLPDVYEKLSEDITNDEILWKRVGPADLRNYEVAEEQTLPEKLKEFCKLFKSIVMFDLMKKYTELDLVPEKDSMKPTMRMELQRWTAGCYTLMSDTQIYDSVSNTTDMKSASNLEAMEEDHSGESANADQVLKHNPLLGDGTDDNCLGEAVNTPPSSGDEADTEILKRVLNGKSPKTRKKYINLYQATSSNVKVSSSQHEMRHGSDSEEADVDENGDDEISLSIVDRRATKSKKCLHQAACSIIQISPSKFEMNRGTDSEESDIEDYMSDPNEHVEDDREMARSFIDGSLDVIIQFHTNKAPDCVTIDYVNPKEESALIHVPTKDNYLCLVYKTNEVCRVHNYVNHYCKGYYYNLLCTYYE